jgi:FkbM family methyltransferase
MNNTIDEQIELLDGIYWPKIDKICRPYTLKELDMPSLISSRCTNRRSMIQAGGNVGVYALEYSKFFETVYTFEPEKINFHCLTLNTRNTDNIFKFQSCLGYNSQPVSLNIKKNLNRTWKITDPVSGKVIESIQGANVGGFYVQGEGNIPTIDIDSLNLQNVDLIHLDIEGFEGFALLGAIKTILKFRPIIAVELAYNNGDKFNFSTEKVTNLLISLGYELQETIYKDSIFTYKC